MALVSVRSGEMSRPHHERHAMDRPCSGLLASEWRPMNEFGTTRRCKVKNLSESGSAKRLRAGSLRERSTSAVLRSLSLVNWRSSTHGRNAPGNGRVGAIWGKPDPGRIMVPHFSCQAYFRIISFQEYGSTGRRASFAPNLARPLLGAREGLEGGARCGRVGVRAREGGKRQRRGEVIAKTGHELADMCSVRLAALAAPQLAAFSDPPARALSHHQPSRVEELRRSPSGLESPFLHLRHPEQSHQHSSRSTPTHRLP